jgi:hypothetical protein
MSLTLQSIPGFAEIPDASFAAGAAVGDTTMKSLNAAAKFAAVRNEQFWGYYKNGEQVALPVSPVDGYQYARNELVYSWSWYASEAAVGACSGTHTPPPKGSTSGQGTLLQMEALVDQSNGNVTTKVSYYKTSQTDTTDGILLVITHAQRLR